MENEELFDKQIETLLKKGYHEAAGMSKCQFLSYIKPLREKVHGVDKVKKGHIPFIIVIPEHFVSIPKQMSLVKLNDKIGYSYLKLNFLQNTNGVESPNMPYLIFNVENGAAMLKTIHDDYIKQFKKQDRHALTAIEGLAIVTHYPETLNNHYIDLLGCTCKISNEIPCLCLSDAQPIIKWLYTKTNIHVSCRGAASCESRQTS